MLAIIREFKNWRHFLKGAKFKFEVWADHKNSEACYRNKNVEVDRLSRRLDWKVGIENDNENQTLIKEQWIHLVEVVMEETEVEILEITKRKDKKVVRVVEEIKKAGVKVL